MTKSNPLRRLSILTLVALGLAVAACTSSTSATETDAGPQGCNAGCLCILDEPTCSERLGCLWKSGTCYNVGVPDDAGSDASIIDAATDAQDASDDASDDASTTDAGDD